MESVKIFGDKSDFAIQYRPCPGSYNYAPGDKLAICHLIIAGKLIGNADEECFLPTWLFNITAGCQSIADREDDLFPEEFDHLSDREIFEIILKANQLEFEYHPDFLYLPVIDHKFWGRHSFSLDETIDAYLFYFYVKNKKITFLIEDNSKILSSDERSHDFLFHSVDLDHFIKTIKEATTFLLQQYPYLEKNVHKRRFTDE